MPDSQARALLEDQAAILGELLVAIRNINGSLGHVENALALLVAELPAPPSTTGRPLRLLPARPA